MHSVWDSDAHTDLVHLCSISLQPLAIIDEDLPAVEKGREKQIIINCVFSRKKKTFNQGTDAIVRLTNSQHPLHTLRK